MNYHLLDDVEFYHPTQCVWVPTHIIARCANNEYLVAGYGPRLHSNFIRRVGERPVRPAERPSPLIGKEVGA